MTERPTVSETLAEWLSGLSANEIPESARDAAGRLVLDVAGLTIAARQTDYMQAMMASLDRAGGPCTILGQSGRHSLADAILANGTAAHGEDFDDTFEGSPLHSGASVVPALLALCEARGLRGEALLTGLVAAVETMGRLTLAAPGGIHRSGFQPAAVLGCFGSAVGASVALGGDRRSIVDAMGLAGSFASGILEFLTDGSWSKRLQPGWAGQAGVRAALLAQSGFNGPRTVLDGRHGFFKVFAGSVEPDLDSITADLGRVWRMERTAFKLYPCGTMIQPYIDCAIALKARGVKPERVDRIVCPVAAPVVERQWEPLAEKQAPSTEFSARFSGPVGVALGLLDGAAGLENYSHESLARPELRDLAKRISYEVDEGSEYPANYTGHVTAFLDDGSTESATQPHLRGGWREPATWSDLADKALGNAHFGGWPQSDAKALVSASQTIFEAGDFRFLEQFGH